jgi:hypothetical protein
MLSGCYFCLSDYWPGAEEVLPRENLYVTQGELLEKIVDYAMMIDVDRQHFRNELRRLATEKIAVEEKQERFWRVIHELHQAKQAAII